LLADEQTTNLYWRYILACFKNDVPGRLPQISNKQSLKEIIAEVGVWEKLPTAPDDTTERIANVPSYKWTKEGKTEAEKQLVASDKRIAEYEGMVASDRKRKTIFKKEVGALS
jgi:hypothetical protein